MADLQKEVFKGWTIFINEKRLAIETQTAGKWNYRWADPGMIFLAKFYRDPKTGIKQYEPVRIAFCRNPVRGVKIRVHPPKIISKTTTAVTITERYRDVKIKVDYTPAIWVGIGALLAGGIIGWHSARKKT